MKRIFIYFALSLLCFVSCEKKAQIEKLDLSSEDISEGLAFSISSAGSENLEVKGGTSEKSRSYDLGGISLSMAESYSDSEEYFSSEGTKGTPIEDSEMFRDSIEYVKVWGWNNNSAISALSSPQLLKKKFNKYYPVDASDNFETIVISDLTWTNPKFYALAPAQPSGTVASITASNSTFSFKYTLPAPDPATNCDAQAQHDFLTGVFSGDESDLTNNTAPLTFDHPLAAIKFQLGTVAEDVTIHSISLADVNSTGKCSVNTTTGAITWSDRGTLKTYVQNIEQSYTTSSAVGTAINDAQESKTFYVIPTTYAYSSAAKIEISYSRGGDELIGTLPLREIPLNAGKTYTFSISVIEGPWIDFGNTDKAGGSGVADIIYAINDSIFFNYAQTSGQYEKFYVPIKMLTVGQWYTMDFTELLSSSSGTYFNGADGAGIYACTVLENAPTSTSRESMITYYQGTDADAYDNFIWMGYEGSSNYASLHKDHNELTFKATAKNMYWVWDTSKCDDGASNMYFKFTVNSITSLNEPSDPAVDYVKSDFYGFWHAKDGDRSDGYSTFKVNAGYGTDAEDGYMEFHMRPNDKYTKLNIPLINLTSGQRYKISFKYKFTVRSLRSERSFGFSVGTTKNTTISSATSHTADDFQDMSGNTTNNTEYSISYEFTASDSTMYWIWDMSRLSSSGRNIMFFYDTRIEEVNAD